MTQPSNKRFLLESDKAVNNGLATLDAGGKIPAGQIPDANKPDNGGKPVGKGELVFNVKDYGAKGDSTGFGSGTDDTANVQAGLTAGAGRKVFVPKGLYRITNGLIVPAGTTVELDKGAVLLLDTDSTLKQLLTIGSNTTLRGGELRGKYTVAADDKQPWQTSGVATNLGRIPGHRLITLPENADQTEAGMTRNVLIEDMILSGSKELAVELKGRGRNYTIRRCQFRDNRENLRINNIENNGLWLMENVVVEDNDFGYTYHVPTGVNPDTGGTVGANTYLGGGNHITAWGGVWDFKLERNKFQHCGRRSVEYYPSPLTQDVAKTRDQQMLGMCTRASIVQNVFDDSDNRTFSCMLLDSVIDGNTIVDMDGSIEASWINTTFVNNRVFAASGLDHHLSFDGTVTAGTLYAEQSAFVTVEDNYFELGKAYQSSAPPAGISYVARLENTQGNVYRGNTIKTYALAYQTFRCRGAADTVIEANRVIFDHRFNTPAGPTVLSAINCRGLRFANNVIQTAKTAVNGFAGGVVTIGAGTYDLHIADNTFDDRSTARLANSTVNIISVGSVLGALTDWSRIAFSADGLTKTESPLTGIGTTPPGSPISGDLWFVAQYPAPTGAWAGHANQFATWSGSAWAFQSINGAIWKPFVDTSSGLNTERGWTQDTWRPLAQVGPEAEFTNVGQDNNVYLSGPIVARLTIENNRFLFNVHHVSEPTRVFNAILVGVSSGTSGFIACEDLAITQRSALPTVNNASTSYPISLLGYQKFTLDRPVSAISQVTSQVRFPGSRLSAKTTVIGEPIDYVAAPDGLSWVPVGSVGGVNYANAGSLPTAGASLRGRSIMVFGGTGVSDRVYVCRKNASEAYEWAPLDN